MKTELAFDIATKFGQLVEEQDRDGKTGLQLLSCNTGAFQRHGERGLLNSGPFQEQSSYIVVPSSKKQWKNKSKNINVL